MGESPHESPSTEIEETPKAEATDGFAQSDLPFAERGSLDACITGFILDLQRKFPERFSYGHS